MSVEETLRRVEADLARGDAAMARQRLRGLVGSFPHRLDVRARLAQVYRDLGDQAQAGRWSYLAPNRVEQEQAAFKARYANDSLRIMAVLAWRGSEDDAPTDEARERLRALRAAAEHKAGTSVSWERPRWAAAEDAGTAARLSDFAVGCALVCAVLLGVIGALAAIINGIHVVVGWLS